jgi:hypothetical protein
MITEPVDLAALSLQELLDSEDERQKKSKRKRK